MQWMANSVLRVSLCPVRAPQCFAGSAYLPVEAIWWFAPHSPPEPDLTREGGIPLKPTVSGMLT